MVAIILIICAVIGTIYVLRKKNLIGIKLSGGVRFDNPPFRSKTNQPSNDTLQIIQNEIGNEISDGVTQSEGWKQEILQVAPATEVNPTIYEELRLGTDGAGFKRLK